MSAKTNIETLIITAKKDADGEFFAGCIADCLQECDEYVTRVAAEEQQIQSAYFRMEADELRKYVQDIDFGRRIAHEAMMAKVNLLNRLCAKFDVRAVADVREDDRESYAAFAKQVVDDYFDAAAK